MLTNKNNSWNSEIDSTINKIEPQTEPCNFNVAKFKNDNDTATNKIEIESIPNATKSIKIFKIFSYIFLSLTILLLLLSFTIDDILLCKLLASFGIITGAFAFHLFSKIYNK